MGSRKLDINKASVEEFAQLAGIGQAKAEAIVGMRNEIGKFAKIDDLQKVPGIGQGLMNQHRSALKCGRSKTCLRQRPKQEAKRITRHTATDQPSVPEKHDVPTARAHRASVVSTSSDRRYRTRSCGVTKVNVVLRSVKLKQRAKRHQNQTKLSTLGSRRQNRVVDRLSVEVEVRPCSSRVEDSSNGSTNTESTASEHAFVAGSGDRALQCAPGCSKNPDVFLSAQNFEARGFTNRTMPSDNAEDCRAGAQQAPNSNGNEGRLGSALNTVEGSVLSGSSQQMGNSRDDGAIVSTQSRFESTSETSDKRLMKRKCEASECNGLVKRIFSRDESGFDSQEEILDEQQTVATCESHQSALRKQKIPSRKNPPPLLAGWLKTFQNWTHAERLLALDELMEVCDPTEVRHVMQVIEPQFQRDFISLLPKELALYVLSFLEPNDLLRAAQTCRYWHMLAEDNILWREKCHEEGISESLVFGNIARRKRMCSRSPWKNLYLRQQQIEQNWRASSRPPKVLKGHDDHVITCLEFNGTKIVSGSDDNTLKVWSAITGKCLRTLTGHTGGVWSSQMSGSIIISGSTDRTLKVWDADTGRTIYTLYGHTSTVRCMHLYNNRVVSGSRDATLRMWDIDTGHCLHVLIGHMAAVRCVQYDGRRVVSGAYDYMVKIWDPEKETCLQTLTGHTNRVYSLQFDGVHIVSGSLDTSIRVWSAETGACLHTLVGHQSLTSGMELKDNILVSGNADSTVKVWNITTGQCLQTLNGPNKHQSAVTCLQFNRKLIITSSDDGTIKIWDLKTGDFIRNLVSLESGGSGGVVWRIRCNNSKLICAVGSRNGTEETKLLVLDFDVEEESSNGKVTLPATSS